jgi:hypothetical protein
MLPLRSVREERMIQVVLAEYMETATALAELDERSPNYEPMSKAEEAGYQALASVVDFHVARCVAVQLSQ